MSDSPAPVPEELSDEAREALRKECCDLEWYYRTQLSYAYAAGKVVRAIFLEQLAARPPEKPLKYGRPAPPPPPLFLADPRNRVARNEFLADALENGLVHQFGYHELNYRFCSDTFNSVVNAQHSL